MPMIMKPMYLNELYGAMLPGVKKIACKGRAWLQYQGSDVVLK